MGSSIKNYTEQGGERTVIGGELAFEEGARVAGFPPSSGAVVLDMQGFNLASAIGTAQDISEIISPDQFRKATAGNVVAVFSNATFGEMIGLSMQGLEISQGQMIFAVGFLPQDADISFIISMKMYLSKNGVNESVIIKVGLNSEMNAALGFSLD